GVAEPVVAHSPVRPGRLDVRSGVAAERVRLEHIVGRARTGVDSVLVDAAVAVAGDAVPGHFRSHTVQLDPVAVVGMPVLTVARDRVVLVDVPERARELTDTGHPVSRD